MWDLLNPFETHIIYNPTTVYIRKLPFCHNVLIKHYQELSAK